MKITMGQYVLLCNTVTGDRLCVINTKLPSGKVHQYRWIGPRYNSGGDANEPTLNYQRAARALVEEHPEYAGATIVDPDGNQYRPSIEWTPETKARLEEYVEARAKAEESNFLTDDKDRLANKVGRLRLSIRRIACECNCRADHGAEGAEHLKAIEEMLLKLLDKEG